MVRSGSFGFRGVRGALGLVAASLLAMGCGGSGAAAGPGKVAGADTMTSGVDRARCDDRGKQVVKTDINGDGRPDVIKLYRTAGSGDSGSQVLVCKQVDMNNDARIDIVYHYDDAGAVSFEEFDLDFDGRFDLRAFYQGGRKVREEMDMNYDGRVDFTKFYEGDKLVRIERDSNNDGRVDEWQYYENGKLDRIGYDSGGTGRVDRWERSPEAEAGLAAEAAPAGATAPPPAPTQPPAAPAK